MTPRDTRQGEARDRPDSRYAWYVLLVLVIVYVFNAMDRSILSILAEDIKRSFHLSDSQLGFLYGTAFSVFYALFGYPVGRFMDRWSRTKILAIGLGLWSLMTACCGLSGTYLELAVSRMGMSVGEASASPGCFSLVSDWFTKGKRATALGILLGGFYIGGGLALGLGGTIAKAWDHGMSGGGPLFGLQGWQAAFLALGIPGMITAVWVATLREPSKGLSDGVPREAVSSAFRHFLADVASVMPPLTLVQAARFGLRPLMINVLAAAVMGLIGWGLVLATGDAMQWVFVAIGFYACFSAAQAMQRRDRPTFDLTWRSLSFVMAMVGFGATSCIVVIAQFWLAPLSLRALHMDKATSGLILGSTTAVFGFIGVIGGGKLADFAIRFSPKGRVWVGMASTVLVMPFTAVVCTTTNPTIFYLAYVPIALFGNSWIGAGAATIQELVLPRMRATATTLYFFMSTMIGSAVGPYVVGKISVATGNLGLAMLICSCGFFPIAVAALWLCGRTVETAEGGKWVRAQMAGEPC